MDHPYQIQTKRCQLLTIIEDIVNYSSNNQRTTLLLICSTREHFLDQLKSAIIKSSPENLVGDFDQDNHDNEKRPTRRPTTHPLITPTLHLLSTSQNIKLVFLPNIPIFRAYVSVYTGQVDSSNTNTITVLDLIALHHDTSEFSLQGLSRSIAALVSAAYRTSSKLRLIECEDRVNDDDDDDDNDNETTNPPQRGPGLWNAQVPLLSGSVKLGGVGATWARRSIVVKRVLERWFDLDDEEKGEEEKNE